MEQTRTFPFFTLVYSRLIGILTDVLWRLFEMSALPEKAERGKERNEEPDSTRGC